MFRLGHKWHRASKFLRFVHGLRSKASIIKGLRKDKEKRQQSKVSGYSGQIINPERQRCCTENTIQLKQKRRWIRGCAEAIQVRSTSNAFRAVKQRCIKEDGMRRSWGAVSRSRSAVLMYVYVTAMKSYCAALYHTVVLGSWTEWRKRIGYQHGSLAHNIALIWWNAIPWLSSHDSTTTQQ